ncbi:Ubiquitin [Mactra antiquata]
MPWIEGIGDEVTITVSIFLGLFVLLAAWISTGIRDIPFISVIIVQLTRRPRGQAADATPTNGSNVTTVQSDDQTSLENTEGSFDPLIRINDGDHDPLIPDFSEDSDDDDVDEAFNDSESSVENVGASSPQEGCTESTESEVRTINSDQSHECVSTDSHSDVTTVDNDKSSNQVSGNNVDEPTGASVEDLNPTELRQRRLQFFSGNSNTCSSKTPLEVIQNSQSASENVSTCGDNDKAVVDSEIKTDSNNTIESSTSDNVHSRESSGNTTEEIIDNTESPSATVTDESNNSGEIRVRIKFLNDTQRLVTTPPNETIGNFRRRHFEEELSQSKLVRFIFNGQDLRNDSSTLQSYNISDNSVLHCLVTQQPEQRHSPNVDDNGFDIGVFMFPLFGLLLGIVWYMRIMYRQFFNVTSTLTLGGITFLFFAALMSSLRGNRAHEHID